MCCLYLISYQKHLNRKFYIIMMDRLPVEILEKIFSDLDENSLNSVERVCFSWSQIVAARFWFQRLIDISEKDDFMKRKFSSEGWCAKESSEDFELNRRLYRKVKSDWPVKPCRVVRKVIQCCQLQDIQNKQVINVNLH